MSYFSRLASQTITRLKNPYIALKIMIPVQCFTTGLSVNDWFTHERQAKAAYERGASDKEAEFKRILDGPEEEDGENKGKDLGKKVVGERGDEWRMEKLREVLRRSEIAGVYGNRVNGGS